MKSSKIPRLHLPMRAPTDVIPHLGAPHHYRFGYSAQSLAEHWFAANDIPSEVLSVLETSPEFAGATLVDAFFERSIELGDGKRPSQTDLLAIIALSDRLAVLAIEAKVNESFGEYVDDWLKGASAAKTARLARLCATLGLDPRNVGALRYQLLHRTASAVCEAKRYRTNIAAMVVQSFAPQPTGLSDFDSFCAALGRGTTIGHLSEPLICEGVSLYLGWTQCPVPVSS